MYRRVVLCLLCLTITSAQGTLFNFFSLKHFVGNETGNELWHGIVKDCRKKVSFSCIQKNAYSYLDTAFTDRDNITVFDGLTLRKNNLDYQYCSNVDENLVENSKEEECQEEEVGRDFASEPQTPLEEITSALRRKAVKFLATRDYEIQLPEFFFEGASFKISPKEVDDSGALVRVDFGQHGLQSEGRIFKKIKKFIQSKLLMSFLALMLVIKLIKLKFMFVIPFLFGIGTAKKLFLKLLLFFVPAFAHVFKLCSSYYSSHVKYHHHHHKIAHHHHHVPVPVPVPAVSPIYDFHPHHPHEEEFEGYDYAHPHIQYRKDMEELKEWGIEPYEEPYDGSPQMGPVYPAPYGAAQFAANPRPTYADKVSAQAHNLAYSGYVDDGKVSRRTPAVSIVSAVPTVRQTPAVGVGPGIGVVSQNPPVNIMPSKPPLKSQPAIITPHRLTKGKISRQAYDDEFYGPIVAKLDEIFTELRFVDESCKERLVCSMYKNPSLHSPHSNLVSNELSRDLGELKVDNLSTESSKRFHLYFNAARLGQSGGDCLRTYPCHINTE